MIDADKWIESARVSLDELEKEVKRLRHELEIKKEALAKSQSSYKELRKQLKAMIE